MASFNKVTFMGHLARDPELRYTPQGVAVCDLTLAANRRFTKKDGEKGEEVVFVDVTIWNHLAETCAEYLKKGRCALVSGRLTQDRWEDPNTGQKRSKLRIVAEEVTFVGSGSKDEEPAGEATPAQEDPTQETPAPDVAQKGTNGKQPAKPRR